MNLDCPHSNYWSVVRLKDVLSSVSNKTCATQLPYIALEHIEGFSGKLLSHCVDVYEKEIEGTYNEFQVGDVLFGKLRPYLAKCWLATFSGKCSLEFLVLRSKNINNIFLKYLLLSPSYLHIINSSTYGTKMPRANWTFIGNMKIFLPPYEEQRAIAEYLDREVSRIDRIVELLTAQQERYDQLKRSLISEVISKGLPHHNPSTFRSVRLKDVLLYLETGKREASSNEEILSIGGEHIQNGKFFLDNPRYVVEALYHSSKGKIKKGDTLVVKDGATIGKCMFVNEMPSERMLLNEHVYRLEANCNLCLPIYLYYLIDLTSTQDYFRAMNMSTAQESIKRVTMNCMPIALPAIEEQKEIVEYLDERCGRIDRISELIGRKIELMESLKKSLIEEVVTGQRCVLN